MTTFGSPAALYRFGSFELQPAERRLLDKGVPASTTPRAFDVLLLLVERSGSLVSKEDLFSRVWPKVVVDDSALQVQISALRKILGFDAIATVSGRGYRFVMPLANGDTASDGAGRPPRHNLPPTSSTFIGRDGDIARLRQALARARLVTLTGAGGCGKTRLAMRVASAQLGRHPDGVWMVELAALADAVLVPQAVLRTLAVPESAGSAPLATLCAHLASQRLLLLLDNAEHLLPGVATLADALLRECPGVTLLVTSREKLDLPGESTYRVPSLTLPEVGERQSPDQLMEAESVCLFVDRTRLVRPHFAVTSENAAALAAVCRGLDGIPLAIELAAGRMREMPLDDLAERLGQRFSLLRGGSAGTPPRHRTLRSLIDWSYDLLSDAEQSMLRRLSVFAGGCSLRAAEHVCASDDCAPERVLDLLAALSDKHLVVAEDHALGTRYRLLETVRAYARERLDQRGDGSVWKARHLAHFTGMAEGAWRELFTQAQQSWLERLDADNENFRAALQDALASPATAESGMRLAAPLTSFWMLRGHLAEGRSWNALALASAPPEADPALLAKILNNSGIIASQQSDQAFAGEMFESALAVHRQLGNAPGLAVALSNLGNVVAELGDLARASLLQEESVAILRVHGDEHRLSGALRNVGVIARKQGDYALAEAATEESLALCRKLGNTQGIGSSLGSLAGIAVLRVEYVKAKTLLIEGLNILRDTGDRYEATELLNECAHVEATLSPSLRSPRLWGACEGLRNAIGSTMSEAERQIYEQRVTDARRTLGDDAAFDVAWAEGTTLTLEQAIVEATGA